MRVSDINYVLDVGDATKEIVKFDDDTFTSVITDPPYGVKYAPWDDDVPAQAFLDECLRVSSGCVVWFGAATRMLDFGHYTPQPDRVLIWSPRFTLSKSASHGLAYRYHPIFVWRIIPQRVVAWDVIDDPTETGNEWYHPATKPVSLMTKLVAMYGGDYVFDPFVGSGTTGVACAKLGRDFMGVDINPDYIEIAAKRIRDEYRQTRFTFGGLS